MTDAAITREDIRIKGVPVTLDAVRLANQIYLVSGKLLKTASLKYEWQEDVKNPAEVVTALKESPIRIDFLRFWQRIPETEVKYPYYKEWREVAAIPIKSFDHWWTKQINCKTRNMVRKSQKAGVTIVQVDFNDDFVRGVLEIYNQSPIRRGKPFRHYGKDFATVKAALSVDLDEALFVGAYHKNELIGFIKFVIADRYAMVTLILDKIAHRDKAPTNGLIAKVVEICSRRKIPFFAYTLWRQGSHGKFQKSVGFEKFRVPEYFIPLTWRGKIALPLRLHRGVRAIIPVSVMPWLLSIRAKWYALKFFARDFRRKKTLGKKRETTLRRKSAT